ncbi:Na(+)-translocating NADH-quinone reductase subunit A [Brumimicrobium aurantiacum]|uniref:Na(+)-translocating NADH-quinone reductase subunit A n=1 Tax=Brumimicrobium aurantiacum TaxID=1737063 RepID=A0A3E1EV87_9FLAO|nr:Na(+)-translocating NADH-quinone reductase subunit A [Brumimicrobium aurantiacum]RFC53450.1 Na(+)-translocating NADH-quinone reductase subunit A [Brumimicrobium aurantiacum]
MSKAVRLKKGLDIKLLGEADQVKVEAKSPTMVALKPSDFHGLVPKVVLKEGEKVKRGEVVFYDKYNKDVKFVSPVAGTISEILRGEKRRILEVRISVAAEDEAVQVEPVDPSSIERDEIKSIMLANGLWPFVKQRPLDKIADPAVTPKSIFISAFDSAPLAPDYDFILHGQGQFFQHGLNALAKLTDGKVNLTLNGKGSPDECFQNAKNVEINKISGKHPAGNVGTQIHHFDPIDKGEFVFTLNPQDVVTIGKFFAEGKFDASRIVALTGSEADSRKYYKTVIGANVNTIVEGNLTNDNVRVISGNALTGEAIGADGYLGFYDAQITVLPEGDDYKFFLSEGWLSPGFDKYSANRLFPTWLMPNKRKRLDTNLNGEERGFVVTGEMERVLPFDILPMQLIKAIMVNDIDAMEQLGIYEIAPEDFALCEYVCTSKIDIQEKIREGLDVIEEECM